MQENIVWNRNHWKGLCAAACPKPICVYSPWVGSVGDTFLGILCVMQLGGWRVVSRKLGQQGTPLVVWCANQERYARFGLLIPWRASPPSLQHSSRTSVPPCIWNEPACLPCWWQLASLQHATDEGEQGSQRPLPL